MSSYVQKANEVIASLCYAAWDVANPRKRSGARPQKHRPYAVPDSAKALIDALGIHDADEREREVKSLLLEHAAYVHAFGKTPA